MFEPPAVTAAVPAPVREYRNTARTRRQDRAAAIAAGRKLNRDHRLATHAKIINILQPDHTDHTNDDDEPAPF